MGTRKEVRKRIATIFAGQGFNQVLDYAPVDLQGMDKVLCVYTATTHHEMLSQDLNNNFYRFYLDVFVKRASANAAEDTLDDLHDKVREVARANVSDSNWSAISLDEQSDAAFAEISGVQYRMERHGLLVKVSQI